MTQGRAGEVYDDVASSYDGYRRWWLAIAAQPRSLQYRRSAAVSASSNDSVMSVPSPEGSSP